MSMTLETVKTLVRYFKIDDSGRLFCGHCLGFGRGGEIESTEPKSSSRFDESDRCDGCWKHQSEWPVQEIEATAFVEHVACKIF